MKTRFLVLGVAVFFGAAYICANLVDIGCCSHCKPSKYSIKSEASCGGDGCTCDDRKGNR